MHIRNIIIALIAVAGLTACGGKKAEKKEIDEKALAAKGLVISQTNFPDVNLCKFLLAQGYGADHVITPEEMAAITAINIDNLNIQSLQGIEHFTNLNTLSLNGNPISELQLDALGQLRQLRCSQCGLKKLDVLPCQQLEEIVCSENLLDSVTVTGMPALSVLTLDGNRLRKLTLGDCPQLATLNLANNKLVAADLSGCQALCDVNVSENPLSIEVADYDAFIKSLPQAAPAEQPATLLGLNAERLTAPQQHLLQQKGWKLANAPEEP